ncbi:6639_t:CDS:2 [Scutellospora calospora]|uniref:6639_t:CDS:1 n=1 Tax=Scutellospora calospora TaxID=85575 RepID=A0ACA9KMQ0_9GLOM|nr:6639_t:CDS:2 [Scutellospora calospora]
MTEGLILSKLLIKEKGQQFAQAFDIPEESFTFSNEWISRFKRCNGLRKVTIHGEAGKTSNPTEVQDNTEESALEDSSAEETEEIQEQPQERSRGRVQGRIRGRMQGKI